MVIQTQMVSPKIYIQKRNTKKKTKKTLKQTNKQKTLFSKNQLLFLYVLAKTYNDIFDPNTPAVGIDLGLLRKEMLSHLASKRRVTMTLLFRFWLVCLSTKLFTVVFL